MSVLSDQSGPWLPVTLDLTDVGINTPRTFKDENLQAAIDRVVAQLGPEDHVAVVAHGNLKGGASLSAIVRLDGGFSIMAAAFKDWHGPLTAAAQLVWKPKLSELFK